MGLLVLDPARNIFVMLLSLYAVVSIFKLSASCRVCEKNLVNFKLSDMCCSMHLVKWIVL